MLSFWNILKHRTTFIPYCFDFWQSHPLRSGADTMTRTENHPHRPTCIHSHSNSGLWDESSSVCTRLPSQWSMLRSPLKSVFPKAWGAFSAPALLVRAPVHWSATGPEQYVLTVPEKVFGSLWFLLCLWFLDTHPDSQHSLGENTP